MPRIWPKHQLPFPGLTQFQIPTLLARIWVGIKMAAPNFFFGSILLALLMPLGGCNLASSGIFDSETDYSNGYISGNDPQNVDHRSARVSGAATAAGGARRALWGTEVYAADRNSTQTRTRPTQTSRVSEDGGVTLNFVNARLSEVVDVVLGDILGQNYTISDRLQGTVTTRTNAPIPRSDLLPVLENLLTLNGASLIDASDIWHVVPFDETRNISNVVVTPNQKALANGYGIHFIRLEHAPVSSVISIVSDQANPGRQIIADPDRNLIIFVGPAKEANAIEDMVSVLDIDLSRISQMA